MCVSRTYYLLTHTLLVQRNSVMEGSEGDGFMTGWGETGGRRDKAGRERRKKAPYQQVTVRKIQCDE